METLIKAIKEKRELRGLPDSLVKSTINDYISKNHVKDLTKKSAKIVIKEVRSELRRYSGQYSSRKRSNVSKKDFSEFLKEHKSTRERLPDYPLVKQIIDEINPSKIMDLGWGLNPLAIADSNIEYHVYDINGDDLKIVRDFFNAKNINGKIYHEDIRNVESFPKVDLCIIFKVLDILGKERNEISRKLLEKIDSRYFIVSFATRTLSGKPMNFPYRRWFEKILNNLRYKYEVKRTSQELFYIIEKS